MSSLSPNSEANASLSINTTENVQVVSIDETPEEKTAISDNGNEKDQIDFASDKISDTEVVEKEYTDISGSETEEEILITTKENNPYVLPIVFGGIIAGAAVFGIIAALLSGRKKKIRMNTEVTTIDPHSNSNNGIAAKVILDEVGAPVKIGRVHDIGRRSMQQDSFGVSDIEDLSLIQRKGVMAVVADGMGGLSDGERMSQMVVVKMLQGFDDSSEDAIPSSTLLGLVGEASFAVNKELGSERIGKCGSTVVAVIVRDRKLSWISVGDSHIYVYRKGKLIQLNIDHNYGTELDDMVKKGEISFEEAYADPQRAALTSFIGIGELKLIDQNEIPIAMEEGDRILLMSDGVYGTVEEQTLTEIMSYPFREALSAIDRAVRSREKSNQDNYTCLILEIN